jgi:nitroreductase
MKGQTLEAVAPADLLQTMRARYAVKKFDPKKTIEGGVWDALEQTLVLSPSSYGLQPWKFFVVEDAGLRAKLKAASWGQGQIVDADKLVVFAGRDGFAASDVDRFTRRVAEVRGVALESLEGYRQMMLNVLKKPDLDAWVARQVYIALGTFLTAAAALGVDACPMEGIEPAKYDELLGLKARGWRTLVVAAAGVRAADDAYAGLLKVRFAREEVIERL